MPATNFHNLCDEQPLFMAELREYFVRIQVENNKIEPRHSFAN